MSEYRRYNYRIYPTNAQKIQIDKEIGASRAVYNLSVAFNNAIYRNRDLGDREGKPLQTLSYAELSNVITRIKRVPGYEWLNEVSSTALQQSLRQYDVGRRIAFKSKVIRLPVFHSRHTAKWSVQYSPQGIRIPESVNNTRRIVLPKLGGVKIKLSRDTGTIRSANLTKHRDGTYEISIVTNDQSTWREPILVTLPRHYHKKVGVDLGVKDLATLSNGIVYPKIDVACPNFNKWSKKLKDRQASLSRKVKGSKSRDKAKLLVAKAYAKLKRIRKDMLHKVSTDLSNYTAIAMEDLDVRRMTNRISGLTSRMTKQMLDHGLGTLISMVEYKAGIRLKLVNPYNTSKKCHRCKVVNTALTLKDREWECKVCGAVHDRDINAAINIKDLAFSK